MAYDWGAKQSAPSPHSRERILMVLPDMERLDLILGASMSVD